MFMDSGSADINGGVVDGDIFQDEDAISTSISSDISLFLAQNCQCAAIFFDTTKFREVTCIMQMCKLSVLLSYPRRGRRVQ